MQMIIKQKENKFYLYFDKIHPANLCFIGYTILTAQAKARKILRVHGISKDNIFYILEND